MRLLLRTIRNLILLPFRWLRTMFAEIKSFLSDEPEDTPLGDSLGKAMNNPESLLVHVNALRKHLTRAAIVMAMATIVAFAFATRIIDLLAYSVGGIEELVAIDPTEPIGTFMRVSLMTAFAVTLPYLILEIWLFIAPGLSRDSRVFGLYAIPVAVIFFLGGMAFAFFVLLPQAVPFLINFGGITSQIRPSSYIRFVTSIMFWLGVAFQFPLIIYVLARVGLIKAKVLSDNWRLAIVIIAVLSAMITPTIDPVNMALVMGPMIVLYFLGIALAKIAERARARSLRDQEPSLDSITPSS
ncbi:MAG TPA: twin-arginine translocase subunit TatC [Anaerolineales bacterium]|nr:twin-arginine translocase subunit TatC [Anaerolineales bacterium]